MIILLHIPKTGGTSLRVAAERYFGPEKMLYDYGPDARLTSPLVRRLVYETPDLRALAGEARELGVEFLTGHIPLEKYEHVFPGADIVSWVREPAARLWSAYLHYCRHHGYEDDFRTFYSQVRFRNQQSRALGPSLERLAFVGVTEQFGRSLKLFNERFGLGLVQHRSNKSPAHDRGGPGESDFRRIRELNGDDYRVYASVMDWIGQI